MDLRIPPGFAVTTQAFNTFLDRGRVRNQIARTLPQIQSDAIKALEKAGRQIRDLIESTPIPKKIVEEIKEGWQ